MYLSVGRLVQADGTASSETVREPQAHWEGWCAESSVNKEGGQEMTNDR